MIILWILKHAWDYASDLVISHLWVKFLPPCLPFSAILLYEGLHLLINVIIFISAEGKRKLLFAQIKRPAKAQVHMASGSYAKQDSELSTHVYVVIGNA